MLSACSIFSGQEDCGPRTMAPIRATSKPYVIKGVKYTPQLHYEYEEEGVASFYGGRDDTHGKPTATGEKFDMHVISAAHKTIPIPSMVEVTNLENGKTVMVRVNDRGPFIKGRIIDVSRKGAHALGFERKGIAKVRVRTLIPESLAMNGLPAGGASPTMLASKSNLKKRAIREEILDADTMQDDIKLVAADDGAISSETPFVQEVKVKDKGAYAKATLPPMGKETPAKGIERPFDSGIYVDVQTHQNLEKTQHISEALAGIADVDVIKASGNQYAVRMGPLPSISEADRLVDYLHTQGHKTSRIVMNR